MADDPTATAATVYVEVRFVDPEIAAYDPQAKVETHICQVAPGALSHFLDQWETVAEAEGV